MEPSPWSITAQASITDWTGTFDGTSATAQTLTAVWTVPAGYADAVEPITVELTVNVNTAQTEASTDKEITGATALTAVDLDTDENITDLAALKASGKLPTEVTVTDGTTPAQASITDWTGTFDGTSATAQTLTAVWTVPAGYADAVEPITVELTVNVNTAQTAGI